MRRSPGWFYDTWGFLALANAKDEGHDAAAAADRWRESKGIPAVTSDYVLDETLTALMSLAGPRPTLRYLDAFELQVDAGAFLLLTVDRDRRERSLKTFRSLAPRAPRISFTDCTSFVLMKELGLRDAFTADRHFHRAGTGIRPLFVPENGKLLWSPPA